MESHPGDESWKSVDSDSENEERPPSGPPSEELDEVEEDAKSEMVPDEVEDDIKLQRICEKVCKNERLTPSEFDALLEAKYSL